MHVAIHSLEDEAVHETLFVLTLAYLTAVGGPPQATEPDQLRFSEKKCAVTVPSGDGWQILPELPLPESIVVLADEDGLRIANLMVFAVPHGGTALDEKFTEGFDQGMFVPPLEKLSSLDTMMGGQAAYQATGTAELEGEAVYSLARVTLSGGFAYKWDVMTTGIDPRADERIGRLLEGFRFLNPVASTPPADATRAFSENMGQVFLICILLAGVLFVSRRFGRLMRRRE